MRFEAYRTRNGLRLIEMSREWNPREDESQTVLETLGCDHLFQHLCMSQGTFRARLEPKPWRVVAGQIHRVCHYLGTFGTAPENSTSIAIRAIHDTWCLGNGSLA
ncbi:MAG: hypothetical protein SAK29_31755 [Scytonema sp. PMC 1069.18]|nr:hypothetical protein [Scytonema sp. PMC 1069.18]MEC4887090.1 hypothetical protein [Scytonema sp. PMC 1070.18]